LFSFGKGFAEPLSPTPNLGRHPLLSKSNTGENISFHLTDRRPVPEFFSDAVIDEEGATLYWYETISSNWDLAVAENPFGYNDTASINVFPPGWTSVGFGYTQAPSGQKVLFASYSVNVEESVLAVILRGTKYDFDWQVDLEWLPTAANATVFPGKTHAGFTRTFNELWSSIKDAVDQYVLVDRFASDTDANIAHASSRHANSAGGKMTQGVSHVVVVGHSYGASVAQLVGYAVQEYIDSKLGQATSSSSTSVVVDVISSSPANCGDAVWANAVSKKVNIRRLAFEADINHQIPCAPSQRDCSSRSERGSEPVDIGRPSGTMNLRIDRLPFNSHSWAAAYNRSLPYCNADWFGYYFSFSHGYSYHCFFSQYVRDPQTVDPSCYIHVVNGRRLGALDFLHSSSSPSQAELLALNIGVAKVALASDELVSAANPRLRGLQMRLEKEVEEIPSI